MTRGEWMEQARRDREKLVGLIRGYHPSVGTVRTLDTPITAPAAEAAAEVIRSRIKRLQTTDVVAQFNTALDNGEFKSAYAVLSDTWFGVPESTSCWGIEGFKEAVDLLDDPPEDE